MQENNSENVTAEVGFEIKGAHWKENCLPDLNDLLAEATRHPMAYGRLKRDMEFVVINAIRRDLKGWKADGKISLDITYGEKLKGRKRDYDNIVSAARKIINDALTKSGTIKDDSPEYLMYGRNAFTYTDKVFIRVEIRKEEE